MPVRTEIAVRPYDDKDGPRLLEIFHDAVHRGAAGEYSEEQRRAWAPENMDLAAFTAALTTQQTWVAEIDGTVVGFSDLAPNGYVNMMFAHPDYQGQGIATTLLSQVEHAATTQGMQRLITEASVTARPFFEKRGFMLTAEQWVPLRGQTLTNFLMEKWLTR